MPLWPSRVYHVVDWEVESDPLADSAIGKLLEAGKFRLRDSWALPCDVIATRIIRYPFYPGAVAVEMQIQLPFDEGIALGSWVALAAATSPASPDPAGGKSIFALDGTSEPIHEVNEKLPIYLPDEKIAAAYLRFFCTHVWGDEGGFWICSARDEIPFVEPTDRSTPEIDIPPLKPLEYQGKNKQGHFLFNADVQYGKALFRAKFAVLPGGMVEMVDDQPISKNLPIVRDERVAGLWVLSRPLATVIPRS